MKRLLANLLFCCLLVLPAWSNPVDMATLKRVAHHFLQSRNVPVTKTIPTVVYTASASAEELGKFFPQKDLFYVMNCGDAYVVVAADDRVTPVLGYSTEGAFDVQNIPIQMLDMFESYRQEIVAILSEPACKSLRDGRWAEILSDSYQATKGTAVVGPLLETTWAQGRYYNRLCPEDNT